LELEGPKKRRKKLLPQFECITDDDEDDDLMADVVAQK
jgi:hypothetical protein